MKCGSLDNIENLDEIEGGRACGDAPEGGCLDVNGLGSYSGAEELEDSGSRRSWGGHGRLKKPRIWQIQLLCLFSASVNSLQETEKLEKYRMLSCVCRVDILKNI